MSAFEIIVCIIGGIALFFVLSKVQMLAWLSAIDQFLNNKIKDQFNNIKNENQNEGKKE